MRYSHVHDMEPTVHAFTQAEMKIVPAEICVNYSNFWN